MHHRAHHRPSAQAGALGGLPLELRQYLDILKRHKWFILEAIVVVGLAAGILSSLRPPVYQATARVLLTPNDPNQQLNPTSGNGVVGNDPDRYVAGQITIAESEGVAREAVKSLQGVSVGALEAMVSVTQGGQSNVLNVSATSPNPAQARDIADAAAKGYIENRRKAAVSGLQSAAGDIQAKLDPLQTQIAQLDTQIASGPSTPAATSALVSPVNPNNNPSPGQPVPQVPGIAPGIGGAPTTQEALKAARYAAAVQYETLYSRQQELLVDISLKRGDAELIAEAKTPGSPVSPRPKREAVLGMLIGLLLGVGITVLREQMNDRIRTAEEVAKLTGLPILALLPYDDESARIDKGVAVVDRPTSPISEAIRSLRTSIQYLGVDRAVKSIVVTSGAPNEGKSLVSANLAAVFAQAGYRTLLISADLRRSSIDGVFGDLGASLGLTGLVAGSLAGMDIASRNGHSAPSCDGPHHVDGQVFLKTPVERLLLLPSGPTPPNPAELLGSRKMAAVLADCSTTADVIIIDTPPVLLVTDAAVLAAKVDGVILVTAVNESRREATVRATTILEGTGARILGTVVNKSPKSNGEYYSRYYGTEDPGDRRWGFLRRRKTHKPTVKMGGTEPEVVSAGSKGGYDS